MMEAAALCGLFCGAVFGFYVVCRREGIREVTSVPDYVCWMCHDHSPAPVEPMKDDSTVIFICLHCGTDNAITAQHLEHDEMYQGNMVTHNRIAKYL